MIPTILLVEDNDADVELARRAFEKSNIPNRIVVASSGEEALDYLFSTGSFAVRGRKSSPRLILLDIQLPRMSGHDVLRHVRRDERTRWLPVVMLTTSNEERDVKESYFLGANSYLRKPVDFTDFAEIARHVGQYWLRMNEPPPAASNRY